MAEVWCTCTVVGNFMRKGRYRYFYQVRLLSGFPQTLDCTSICLLADLGLYRISDVLLVDEAFGHCSVALNKIDYLEFEKLVHCYLKKENV